MYVLDSVVTQDLADLIKKTGPADLQAWQVNLVTRLHPAAYRFIVAALAKRGYLLSQIIAWDQGADFERSIALALVLEAGGILEGDDAKRRMEALDWRDQLGTVDVTISGVFQPPLGTVGLCHVGTQSTDGDTFVYPGDREQVEDDRETHW